jgi:PAS domain S-box-containing protein
MLKAFLFPAAFWISLFCLSPDLLAQESVEAESRTEVLVLSSYHMGQQWSDAIIGGIRQGLAELNINPANPEFELYFEFLDSKRILFNQDLQLRFEEYLLSKYRGRSFYLVVIDNNALNWALERRNSLFQGVPIVFCGINDFEQYNTENWSGIYGVKEKADHRDTIEVAAQLFPERKKILAVTDTTTTGQAIGRELEAIRPELPEDLSLEILDALSLPELEERMSAVDDQTIVFWTVFNQDNRGKRYSYRESLGKVGRINAPIFSSWSFYFGQGQVGGKIISGERHGRIVAEILYLLKIGLVPETRYHESPNVFMFDHGVLRRWGLDPSQVPLGSIIINEPETIWTQFQSEITTFIIFAIFLVGIIFILMFLLRIKSRLEIRLKENQKELKGSNSFLRTILNNPRELVVLTFDPDQRVDFVNAGASAFFQKGEAELFGLTVEALFGMDEGQKPLPEAGLRVFDMGGRQKELQYAFGDLDTKESSQRILVGLDITKRYEAEKQVEESQRILQQILNEIPSPVFAARESGEIIFANAAFAQLYGKSSLEISGLNHWEMHQSINPGEAVKIRERIRSVIQHTAKLESYQEQFTDYRGNRCFFQSAKLPLKFHDEILCLGISTNISEVKEAENAVKKLNTELENRVASRTAELADSLRKLSEAQERLVESEKMAAMGHLVAGVAHEINTPLGIALTGVTAVEEDNKAVLGDLEKEELTKQQLIDFLSKSQEIYFSIVTNLKKASRLIQTFKELAVNQVVDDAESFSLKTFLEDFQMAMEPKLKEYNIAMLLEIPEDAEIFTSPGALSQVCLNLVMNSLIHGYPEKGPGNITIAVQYQEEEVLLTLTDDGLGMAEEVRKRVFEPFFTTKRGQGGTGLGLQIVFNLVKHKLQGEIQVSSQEGRGSSFELRIPTCINLCQDPDE